MVILAWTNLALQLGSQMGLMKRTTPPWSPAITSSALDGDLLLTPSLSLSNTMYLKAMPLAVPLCLPRCVGHFTKKFDNV